jgi:hypothetical protein
MMEASRISETSVDNYFTLQYIPEDKSELQSFTQVIESKNMLKIQLHRHVKTVYADKLPTTEQILPRRSPFNPTEMT